MEYALIWLAAAGIAGGIVAIVRAVKRQNEVYRQARQRLGLTFVEHLDPQLLQAIQDLVRAGKSKVSLQKVCKREESQFTFYDCVVRNGSGSNDVSQTHLIVGRGWNLPDFRIAPVYDSGGLVSGLLRKATQMVIRHGGFKQVEMGSFGDFTKKYVVVAREPEDVRRRIPSSFWHGLASLFRKVMLRASGDVVAFSVMREHGERLTGKYEERETAALRHSMEMAERLGRLIEETVRSSSAQQFGRAERTW